MLVFAMPFSIASVLYKRGPGEIELLDQRGERVSENTMAVTLRVEGRQSVEVVGFFASGVCS